MRINNFEGEYRFLSNYYEHDFIFEGVRYGSAEAAFQAQKCRSARDRVAFSFMTAPEAKQAGRKVSLRPDWEQVKVRVMQEILSAKFSDPDLAAKLIATGDAYLEEGNDWGDCVWGTVDGSGANLLGQMLMDLRKKLGMLYSNDSMVLYHGSDHKIVSPQFGFGHKHNDYGLGFYMTQDIEKARAWAVANGHQGRAFCNEYRLDFNGLTVLNLEDCGVLAWIAEVLYNRGFTDQNTKYIAQALIDAYKVDTSSADVIIGYRADDSYMEVLDRFLAGELNADELERFFRKGELGQQVVAKSDRAFRQLSFVGCEQVVNQSRYFGYDIAARRETITFIENRQKAIQVEGYEVVGLTAGEAVTRDYCYNHETNSYFPRPAQELTRMEDDHDIR